jgi:hypothetical protein
LFQQPLISAMRFLNGLLAECAREAQYLFDRFRAIEDIREARGMALLREWLSAEQRAQFDATRSFEVTGCDSGKRYCIRYGAITNVHELDSSGHPVTGWCFVPSGGLVAGDVMLAQKIALETDEKAALKVANQFPVRAPEARRASVRIWRAY